VLSRDANISKSILTIRLVSGSFLKSILFVSLCLTFSTVQAANTSSESTEYYSVDTNDKTLLLNKLNQATPITEGGETFYGKAHSYITWKYTWRYDEDECWIVSAETDTATTYTLPLLITNNAQLQAIWDEWFRKLELHERGHHMLALNIAKQINSAIESMPSKRNCELLEHAANEIGNELIEELDKRNKAYDKRTEHGHTQGASLGEYLR
jgi:predicted secreted Zn-dependent protease